MLLLSFSDVNTAILSSSNEANPLQANHFFVVLFSRAFTKDVNGWAPQIRHVLVVDVISVKYFFWDPSSAKNENH